MKKLFIGLSIVLAVAVIAGGSAIGTYQWAKDGILQAVLAAEISGGEQGEQGIQGAQGAKGDKGDKGDKGEQGELGTPGKDGETPYIGNNGNWWIGETDTGIQAQGEKGADGEKGEKGDPGKDGTNGIDGQDGDVGISAGSQLRQDTADEWALKNPVLKLGELGYDTTNDMFKIGDGISSWNFLPFIKKDYSPNNLTWAKIAEISASGNAQKYFSVGDEVTVTLSTNEKVTFVILGFNHDDLTSGGKAGITFGMENLLETKYRMNATNINTGGWNGSEMRNTTIPEILESFPTDLQAVIKTVDKKAAAGNQSLDIVTSADKLFLFSRVEFSGETTATYADEGKQYKYWRTTKDGSSSVPRKKFLGDGEIATAWWLRSPSTTNQNFYSISTGGVLTNTVASNSFYGICVGFCV